MCKILITFEQVYQMYGSDDVILKWPMRSHDISCHFKGWKHFTPLITDINSSLPGQNGRLFADDAFRFIFMNQKLCVLIKISLKIVPKGPIDIMAVLI